VSAALALGALLLICAAAYVRERHRRPTRAMPGGWHPELTLRYERAFELYHNAFSLGSKKVRLCLDELGIDYLGHEIELIETGAYANLTPEFLAVNPAGLVPVLVHEGHPVYESHEILVYAAGHAPPGAPPLMPADPTLAAQTFDWIDRASLRGDDPIADAALGAGDAVAGLSLPLFAAMLEAVPYERFVDGLLYHRTRSRPLAFGALKRRGVARLHRGARAMRVLRDCATHLRTHFDALERRLDAGGPWIVGDAFGLADVSWAAILERLREADALEPFTAARPALAAYWQRLRARPGYRSAFADHTHPAAAAGLERLRAAKRADPELREALEAPCR